jgi:hypothetical protein
MLPVPAMPLFDVQEYRLMLGRGRVREHRLGGAALGNTGARPRYYFKGWLAYATPVVYDVANGDVPPDLVMEWLFDMRVCCWCGIQSIVTYRACVPHRARFNVSSDARPLSGGRTGGRI